MLKRLTAAPRRWARRSELVWRHGSNWRASRAFRRRATPPSALTVELVRSLRRDGMATTTVRELCGDESLLDELRALAARLEQEQAGELEACRERARRGDARAEKDYLVRLGGWRPSLAPGAPLADSARHPAIVEVAEHYLRLRAHLGYANLWRTAVSTGDAYASQLWHHDRDDLHHVFKVFVHLSDVDEGSGPFVYAKGSHRLRRAPRAVAYDGNTARADDGAMAEVVPPESWATVTGGPGTVLFVDTRGYHKGSPARQSERLVFTCMYTSPFAARPGAVSAEDG